MISTPPPLPFLQPQPTFPPGQQPFPGSGKAGGFNPPSPDFSISSKDSFATPSSSNPSSPSLSPSSMSDSAALGGIALPAGMPGIGPGGAAKLPEVTVIGPNPGKNNVNYSLKTILLYGAALLALVLGIKYAWPKIFKKKSQAPAQAD